MVAAAGGVFRGSLEEPRQARSLRRPGPAIYVTSQANEMSMAMITFEPGDDEFVARRLREDLAK